jgi:hypothetical protein
MLQRADFQTVCKAAGGSYHLDLSDVPSELHHPLLRSLDAYGLGLFISFKISCSHLAQFTSDTDLPASVANSIAVTVPNYFAAYADYTCKLISTSKILKEIHVASVDTTLQDLISLARSVQHSHRLRIFDFTDIPITDEYLGEILSELFSPSLTCVSFKHCALTNDCIPIVVKYATEVRRRFVKEGISEIDLSDNDIDGDAFDAVVTALNRFNVAAEEKVRANNRAALEQENQMLRKEIESLTKIITEIEQRGALFIIGSGAPALIERMQLIDSRITALEHS